MISQILEEKKGADDEDILKAILSRVRGIDLNPLAVLTARINYFINIAPFISTSQDIEIEIPVYLGDASYVPSSVVLDGVECLEYTIKTILREIDIVLPKSTVSDAAAFSRTMTGIEQDIKRHDSQSIKNKLLGLTAASDASSLAVQGRIEDLANTFVDLEKNHWNGIWARIVTNFLTTANLERSDIIVGNPPWIDWKSLPAGYRERIKSLCISRDLFSGDGVTGGINLNICALITSVCAQNWLAERGVLGFLMPKPLIFQQSYEGFRELKLDEDKRLYFQAFHDWTKAGKPFLPVQQEFLGYFMGHAPRDYSEGVPVTMFKIKKGQRLQKFADVPKFSGIEDIFDTDVIIAGQCYPDNHIFAYCNDADELADFKLIAGVSEYTGREGIEFYPQELFLLIPQEGIATPKGLMHLENYQNQKSKHRVAGQSLLLETKYLHPLIKGVDIERFHISDPKYVVPFPYDERDTRAPISLLDLQKDVPRLARFLQRFESLLDAQTKYNERIIGRPDAEFYALARVGAYSFAPHHVAFRDNSKWQAAVVSSSDSYHGLDRPLFQNHAAYISATKGGRTISLDEAHFICAIMNSPLATKFIEQSSDSRSFKIRPPINIPEYDSGNQVHQRLSRLSVEAHRDYDDNAAMSKIDEELDKCYCKLMRE